MYVNQTLHSILISACCYFFFKFAFEGENAFFFFLFDKKGRLWLQMSFFVDIVGLSPRDLVLHFRHKV